MAFMRSEAASKRYTLGYRILFPGSLPAPIQYTFEPLSEIPETDSYKSLSCSLAKRERNIRTPSGFLTNRSGFI